ncbi:MAG: hypothetical protein HYY06_08375 [Deltaproteobacteria bacterium]|nr:hypothetical protein [Deltaproteobacteria bacterium]
MLLTAVTTILGLVPGSARSPSERQEAGATSPDSLAVPPLPMTGEVQAKRSRRPR